jgi:hypothetical protein
MESYPWAVLDGVTEDITVDSVNYTVPNKTRPDADFRERGILYGQGMPTQYWNYQLNGYHLLSEHLDGRLVAGDIREVTEDYTEDEVNLKYGGTWGLLGSDTQFATTVYYWIKEA